MRVLVLRNVGMSLLNQLSKKQFPKLDAQKAAQDLTEGSAATVDDEFGEWLVSNGLATTDVKGEAKKPAIAAVKS